VQDAWISGKGAKEFDADRFQGPTARKADMEETQNILRLKTGNG
jgi:hypothetical protein